MFVGLSCFFLSVFFVLEHVGVMPGFWSGLGVFYLSICSSSSVKQSFCSVCNSCLDFANVPQSSKKVGDQKLSARSDVN